jgi:hypothetical protein
MVVKTLTRCSSSSRSSRPRRSSRRWVPGRARRPVPAVRRRGPRDDRAGRASSPSGRSRRAPRCAPPTRDEARELEPWLTNEDFRRLKWIREAEREFQPFHQRNWFAAHPDLSFYVLNGDRPVTSSPYQPEGVYERMNLIKGKLPGVEEAVVAHAARRGRPGAPAPGRRPPVDRSPGGRSCGQPPADGPERGTTAACGWNSSADPPSRSAASRVRVRPGALTPPTRRHPATGRRIADPGRIPTPSRRCPRRIAGPRRIAARCRPLSPSKVRRRPPSRSTDRRSPPGTCRRPDARRRTAPPRQIRAQTRTGPGPKARPRSDDVVVRVACTSE